MLRIFQYIQNSIVVSFCIILFISCAEIREYSEYNSSFIDLSGKWKVIESDNDDIANPNYDDSNCDDITIPGSWDYILENNDNLATTIWIRKKITISEKYRDRLLVLSLGTIAIADETYVNGTYINGNGTIPSKTDILNYEFAWQKDRNYLILSDLIKYNDENVIAIKIFSHLINGIKENPKLIKYKTFKKHIILLDYLPSIYNFNPLLLSLTPVIFLLLIIKGSKKRNIVFYSGLWIISIAILHLLLLGIPKFDNGLNRYKIVFSLILYSNLNLVFLVQNFFNRNIKWINFLFSTLLIIFCIFLIYAPTTKFLVDKFGITVIIILSLYTIYTCYIFLASLLNDPRRYWYFTFVALYLFIITINFLYYLITYQMYKLTIILTWQPIAIITGGMFYYIVDIMDVEKERDSLAKALLQKSKIKKPAKRIIANLNNIKKNNNIKPEPKEVIYSLIYYLDNNYNETYDRKQLAKKFGLNEDYMGQIFKKVTDTNIAYYINTRRIEAAKQLIKDTDSKIIDIAYNVGFDNLTYFYRIFKKQTGSTPTEFKSKVHNQHTDTEHEV